MFVSNGSTGTSVDIGDNVPYSLMLDASASQYLSKTFGVPTNRRIWTMSFWMKRGAYGAAQNIVGTNTVADTLRLGGAASTYSTLTWYWNNAASYSGTFTSALRDMSAYYHVVVATDTTQATGSNRMKVYLNGKLLTNADDPTYTIPQNYDGEINKSGSVLNIGKIIYDAYYDGYFSTFIFVDGQQLTASDFGRVSIDTGQWVNKDYVGTYGANGFKLNFADSADLGAIDAGLSISSNLSLLGTNIGGMTLGGGLAAAFNGHKSTASASSAQSSAATAGYVTANSVGKDWGVGVARTIKAFRLTTSTDTGLRGDAVATGFKLQGSTDNFSSSVVDLYAGTSIGGTAEVITVTSGITTTTAYRYHRIVINGNGVNSAYLAELEFFDDGIVPSLSNNLRTLGTNIGGMTSAGGLASMFDGVLSSINSAGGMSSAVTAGYVNANAVGKDWGAGVTKTITAFRVYTPSDTNLRGDSIATGYKLQGSTDNFSSSVVDLYAGTSVGGTAEIITVTSGITTTTAYRYHRFVVNGNGTNNAYIAEVEFYTDSTGPINKAITPSWTLNGGITSANQYLDTPTNNFAVLNPLRKGSAGTVPAVGNLKLTITSGAGLVAESNQCATFAPTSGKWYWEVIFSSFAGGAVIGLMRTDQSMTVSPFTLGSGVFYGYSNSAGNKVDGSSATAYGVSYTTGDVIGVAYDADVGTLTFYKNNASQGTAFSGISGTFNPHFVCNSSGLTSVGTVNFGAKAFTYTPPAGYVALCTANLPTPAILKPSLHFNADAYIGNGSSIVVRDNQQTPAVPTTSVANSLLLNGTTQYLYRTFGAPTINTTWTFSTWIKRNTLGTGQYILSAGNNGTHYNEFGFDTSNRLVFFGTYPADAASLIGDVTITDTSSWHHLLLTLTGTTLTLKVDGGKSNGGRDVIFSGGPLTSNNNAYINGSSQLISLGARHTGVGDGGTAAFCDMYFAESHFVDGQALTVSDFGQFNQVTQRWEPKTYTGTYGANGFRFEYLDPTFSSGNTGLGKDTSTNAFAWTLAGSINSSNQYIDTPTNNFVTVSQTDKYSTVVVSKGNLALNCASGNRVALTGFGLTSGKWYFEGKFTGTMTGGVMGVARANVDKTQYVGFDANGWGVLLGYTCNKLTSNVAAGAGSSYIGTSALTGEVVCCALDMDNGKVWWRLKNGAWGGSAGGDPVAGTGEAFGGITGPVFPAADGDSRGEFLWNFGATAFAYSAPAGFNKITSQSLPKVQDFAPDLIWLKSRTAATDNVIVDSVRGWDKKLITNTTAAEVTDVNVVTQTLDGGYVLGNTAAVNTLAATYVGWSWKGGGAAVTNNVGTIASQVSANTTAGISIVTYTGATGNQTVGHGVQVGGVATAPKMIIVKGRNTTTPYGWFVYHASTASPSTTRLEMQSTAAAVSGTPNPWASTAPSTTVFSLYAGATYPEVNENGKNYLALCFAEVEGFSKIGSYTGNAAADGTFVYCGFKPRWIIIKSSTAATDWYLIDTARDMNNECVAEVNANNAVAEQIGTYFKADMVANGFKLRIAGGETNAAQTYIFYAIAEAPMKFSTAR